MDLSTVNAIFDGSDKRRAPKMCRKCFLAYKKYSNSHDVLQDNWQKAIAVQSLASSFTPPLSKRPRIHNPLPFAGPSSSNRSPDVVVCHM